MSYSVVQYSVYTHAHTLVLYYAFINYVIAMINGASEYFVGPPGRT